MAFQATRNPARFVPGARWDNVTMCALVLEDAPVGPDSRLVFESFPEEGYLEETYSLAQYREMGGNRMPQPQYATYQGGGWSTFPLTLKFRAGMGETVGLGIEANTSLDRLEAFDPTAIERLLIEMERKVNWCMALGFPLERENVEGQRILKRAQAGRGTRANLVSSEQAKKLRRNDPPFVLLVFGSWKIIRGYLSNIVVRWEGPWHPISARPYGATVRMQFNPLMSQYPTWQSIRHQAGRAGLSAEFPRLDRVTQTRLRAASRAASNLAGLVGLVA